jgi:glycosyltransferase involved in cell wall biosynthesis
MKVLFLTRHGSAAASCRHRVLQYVPFLERAGIQCTVSPFFDNAYSEEYRRNGHKSRVGALRGIGRRLAAVSRARSFDVAVIHTELLPFVPAAVERWLLDTRVPLVLDYDDAFFHRYERHRLAAVRWVLGRKIARLAEMVRLVIAGSEYLAAYARREGAEVAVIPTTVDLARYPSEPAETVEDVFTLGWVGSPSTTDHLEHLLPELRAAAARRPFKLLTIGARPFDAGGLLTEQVEWREDTEVAELSRCHVGIMPLPDSPWNRGKCGFKLIQAMACWKPVIASPVGANNEIVRSDCGLLALPGEWAVAIGRLRDDADTRRRMGVAGRTRVECDYSLQTWAPRLIDALRQVATHGQRRR